MIALPSFLAAIDKPQTKPLPGEGDAAQGVENAASDGFAALIAQLIEIIPAAGKAQAEADQPAEGQTGNLPTGKDLPVEDQPLAALAAIQPEWAAPTIASPLPASAAASNSSATIISFRQAHTEAQMPGQVESVAGRAPQGELSLVQARDSAVGQAAPRADQIRMTVSVAPVGPAAPGAEASPAAAPHAAVPLATSALALAPHAPSSQDAPVPVERQLVQAAAPQSGETKQSGQDPQNQNPASADRGPSARVSAPDKEFGAAERPVHIAAEAGKPGASATALPVAAVSEAPAPSRSEAARTAAPAPVAAMTSVENIERLVERLTVARDFDMAKSASIAVTHREFGALTVTFDNARSGLDVEIAAKDNDMQRALAQAVAADRPASRAGEPLQQSHQPASQATATGSERGAGSPGQGATSSGAGSQGEPSQNQRDRSLPSSRQDPHNPAGTSPGDDALYA